VGDPLPARHTPASGGPHRLAGGGAFGNGRTRAAFMSSPVSPAGLAHAPASAAHSPPRDPQFRQRWNRRPPEPPRDPQAPGPGA